MVSRNVSRQRTVVKSILWLLCASLMALAAIIPARTESAPTATRPNLATFKIYCASSLDQPIVYFSNIFDRKSKGADANQHAAARRCVQKLLGRGI